MAHKAKGLKTVMTWKINHPFRNQMLRAAQHGFKGLTAHFYHFSIWFRLCHKSLHVCFSKRTLRMLALPRPQSSAHFLRSRLSPGKQHVTASFSFFLRFRQKYAEAQDLIVVPAVDEFSQTVVCFDVKFTAGIENSKGQHVPSIAFHVNTFYLTSHCCPSKLFVQAPTSFKSMSCKCKSMSCKFKRTTHFLSLLSFHTLLYFQSQTATAKVWQVKQLPILMLKLGQLKHRS
jgi:hypothetical protein